MMKQLSQILCFTLFCFVSTACLAGGGNFYALPTRDGVKLPVWLIAPANATDIVILFSGGGGVLEITDKGIKHKTNFLIRTRQMFADRGLVVAIPDKPTDRADLFNFRTTAEHAEDIKVLMQFLRQRFPGKPLWLVGTSRGTISVASVAARIQGKAGPDGIVLTSSLTRGGINNYDSLQNVDLASIRVPTLIVHNKLDECRFTPFSDAEELTGKLRSVKIKAFKAFNGGQSPGDPCQPESYHGYMGIEKPVVNSIVAWIKSH